MNNRIIEIQTRIHKVKEASGHNMYYCAFGIKNDLILYRNMGYNILDLLALFSDVNNHLDNAKIFNCGATHIWI